MAPESVDETHFRENVIGLELPNEPAHNWSCDPLSEREREQKKPFATFATILCNPSVIYEVYPA